MSDYDVTMAIQFFAHYEENYSRVMKWLDDMASKHMSVEEAMESLESKMRKYLSDRYDSMYARARGPVDQFFLWCPEPYWREVTDYFEEDYRERLMDRDSKARAGGIVSRDYYEESLDTLPPLDAPRELLDRYGCSYGFLEGEPYGTGPKGENTYRAFGMRPDGTCLYLGLSPRAKDSEYPDGTRSWNRKTGKTKRTASKQRKPRSSSGTKAASARKPKSSTSKGRRR